MNPQQINQQPQEQQQQQYQQQQAFTAKDSSQNRNIENFLNKSNKYSKESLQFLQEKNTLLVQQQQLSQGNHFKLGKQKEDLTQEVNKIYEIRTQFNKFEQDNRSSQNEIVQAMKNLNINNNQARLSRDDVLVEKNVVANEDLEEWQESEQYTVSSKMRSLQSTSKQTFSISKVELKNLIAPPLPQNLNAISTQDINQGDRQSVNTYVLSPNISARTLNFNINQQNNQQQLQQQPLQQQQQQQSFQKQQIRSQNGQFAQNQLPLQVQSQNIVHNNLQQKIFQQQQHQPLFFNPPSTPDPTNGIHGINNDNRGRIAGVNASNSMINLKSPSNSLTNSQRTLKGITSSKNLANPVNANNQIQVNQSVQSLGYAVTLVNKNIEDLSKHINSMNPHTLQILDLSSNRFSNFPLELCRMKNLKRLKLENNLIKVLPKEIFLELKLESFSVQNNLIQDIPPEICEWKSSLQCLNISRNHLHTFQKYLCYLDLLTSLNISSNDFMDIPIEFIFLVNLKEFSIDWFKYCLPPRKSTVQGNEGLQVLKEMFVLLCNHKNMGFITFLQFTTHFSDKNLIKISSQIKKNKPKQQHQKKFSQYQKIKDKGIKQNDESEVQRKHRLQQLELIAQNQENRFVLNVSNTNLLNTTITSIGDSILPKENDGIQYLPEELKKKKNRLICINKKNTKEDESALENSRSLIEFLNLKQISQNNAQNMQPLSSKRQNRSNSNLQANNIGNLTPGVCKTLIHFSSDSDLSLRDEEALHTHNDLSFFQENQNQGRSNSNIPSAHPLRNKKTSRNFGSNPQQIVKTDENVNFDKILQEVEEEIEEKNDQLIFKHLDLKLDNPPDTLLSSREQRFMLKPFIENDIGIEEEDEIINLDQGDDADENILSESKEEQEERAKSTQCLEIAAPKVYTQYNQIDPKNGRNLMHLAIMDEDISALRCLVNLNFDLVNEVDFDGQTPLSLSILEEKYYSAKILIFNKADVNVGGGVFGSCVTIGVIKQQYYLIRDLIRFGADVNKQDHDGNGPLHYIFQQYYRNPEESNKIAQMLLDNGANPNLENNDKWSPLHFAVKRGCLEAVEFAFNYNRVCLAKKNKRGFMINKAGGQERITILHIASELNHQKIVQLLLKNNADIFARRSDNKLSYQLCQKHTLVKKLLLLSQTRHINFHLGDLKNLSKNDEQDYSNEVTENKFILEVDNSFERYQKRSAEKKKKGKKSQNQKGKKKQESNQDDEVEIEIEEEDREMNIDSDNEEDEDVDDNDCEDDDDDEDDDYNIQSGDYNSNDENDDGDENLIDSADSFPVDMEDEEKIPVKEKVLSNRKLASSSSNPLQKNKLNSINVSSQPRMIKTGDAHIQSMGMGGTHQLPFFNNQFIQFKNKNGQQGNLIDQLDHQLNESKHSLDEIEDEDLKGDAPKWFYKDHSQIPYSPNNLQKIQGMNEIISQIIQQNTANLSTFHKNNNLSINGPLIYPSGIKTPEFQEGGMSLSPIKNQLQLKEDGSKRKLIIKGNYPHAQQYLIQQQLQQQAAKTQTIQACNFFSNLKNYKQVIKSASNIHEYQLKILDEGLALTNRLYFLNQLKLIQFKLLQILSLITRQSIYQLFCRSGIIEDFLKLGDDNLNTLINTSQEFNRSIVSIYRKLGDSPSFDNNSLLVQIINLFGDTCYHLYVLFYDKQIIANQQNKQSQINSQTTLTYALQEIFPSANSANDNISLNSLNQLGDCKTNNQDLKKQDDSPLQTFAQRMKIDYANNIMKEFLELQQCSKIKKDNFTQKTLITDQDFDRMMPTEEEYETENEELTKVLSNYAQIKLRNNPLQEIPKQNKIFK